PRPTPPDRCPPPPTARRTPALPALESRLRPRRSTSSSSSIRPRIRAPRAIMAPMPKKPANDDKGARIKDVSFTILRDPFSARHEDHMPRLSGDWSLVEICRVTLESGVVGVGETIIQYTWGRVPAGAADRVRGRNVFDL